MEKDSSVHVPDECTGGPTSTTAMESTSVCAAAHSGIKHSTSNNSLDFVFMTLCISVNYKALMHLAFIVRKLAL